MSDHASDRFTAQTGYSPVDGTKPSVKYRFRMGRSGTTDPFRKLEQHMQEPESSRSILAGGLYAYLATNNRTHFVKRREALQLHLSKFKDLSKHWVYFPRVALIQVHPGIEQVRLIRIGGMLVASVLFIEACG